MSGGKKMRFENKTAVIATSGGSIGLECARKLEEEGAKVIILDLDHAEAENRVFCICRF